MFSSKYLTETIASPYCCGNGHVTSIPSELIEANLNGTGSGGAVGDTEIVFDKSLAIIQATIGPSTGCVSLSPQND